MFLINLIIVLWFTYFAVKAVMSDSWGGVVVIIIVSFFVGVVVRLMNS